MRQVSLFVMRGDRNYGVDFSGGTLQQYMFDKAVKVDDVRKALPKDLRDLWPGESHLDRG